jgi:two-component system, sensor histidine kinase and response regulator
MKGKIIILFFLLFVYSPSPAQSEQDSLKIIAVLYRAQSIRLNNPDSAIYYCKQTIASLKPKNNYLNGFAYYTLAYSNWVKANYKLSAEYGYRSLKYMETTSYDYEKSLVLLELCRTFLDLRNPEEGRKYLKRVYDIAILHPEEPKVLANYYRELSFYYAAINQNDSAVYASDKGIEIYELLNDTLNKSVLYGRKARILLSENKFQEALQLANKAIVLDSLVKNKRAYGISNYQLASALIGLQQYDKAIGYLKKSINISYEINNWQALFKAHEKLSEVYLAKKEPYKALEHANLAAQFKDSLFNATSSGQIEEMKILYETEQKDNTISLLEKENALKQQQSNNQRIIVFSLVIIIVLLWALLFLQMNAKRAHRKANEELSSKNKSIEQQKEEMQVQAEKLHDLNQLKSKLFSVISHDLRGPINNLQSLLDLFSKNLLTQEEFIKHSDKLKANVNVTQRTLENLLNWSMSQMEGIRTRPTIIDIKSTVDEAARLLHDIANRKEVHIKNNIEDTKLVYADPDQVQVVLRNLIHNGIKFSKSGTTVYVSAKVIDKDCHIIVKDEGIGMTASEIERLELTKDHFTKIGTLQEKGTGLGFLLCREFVEHNGGQIFVKSESGAGTEITFTLPLA